MAKHEEHEEHENHERWLVSYADFITLLFAFFVVMYAVSQVDQKRAIQVEQAVKWALHIAGDGGGGDHVTNGVLSGAKPSILPPQAAAGSSKGEAERARVERRAAGAKGQGRPSVLVHVEGQKLVTRVSAHGMFEPGRAELLPSALPTLDAVLSELRTMKGVVRVEGHTDTSAAVPVTTATAGILDENWALSAARAAAVVSYAQASGFAPERLQLAGHGSTKPVADNATPEGRAQNRRVELVLELPDHQPGAM